MGSDRQHSQTRHDDAVADVATHDDVGATTHGTGYGTTWTSGTDGAYQPPRVGLGDVGALMREAMKFDPLRYQIADQIIDYAAPYSSAAWNQIMRQMGGNSVPPIPITHSPRYRELLFRLISVHEDAFGNVRISLDWPTGGQSFVAKAVDFGAQKAASALVNQGIKAIGKGVELLIEGGGKVFTFGAGVVVGLLTTFMPTGHQHDWHDGDLTCALQLALGMHYGADHPPPKSAMYQFEQARADATSTVHGRP